MKQDSRCFDQNKVRSPPVLDYGVGAGTTKMSNPPGQPGLGKISTCRYRAIVLHYYM